MITITVPLSTTPEQHAQLCSLRAVFVQVCNALAPEVQKTGVWDRVTLHHLHYRTLRDQHPQLGSQMVCNAIYAVSKACRIVYQDPQSPYRIGKRGHGQALPLLQFAPSCPVYFDRHTLNIVAQGISLFTMDGRVRFNLQLGEHELNWFKQAKLLEVMMKERPDHVFVLVFRFDVSAKSPEIPQTVLALTDTLASTLRVTNNEGVSNTLPSSSPLHAIPEYVLVEAIP